MTGILVDVLGFRLQAAVLVGTVRFLLTTDLITVNVIDWFKSNERTSKNEDLEEEAPI